MKKIDDEAAKLTLYTLLVLVTLFFIYKLVKHNTNKDEKVIYEDIRIDEADRQIDSLDNVIDTIPFTYPDDVRSDYFKNYGSRR